MEYRLLSHINVKTTFSEQTAEENLLVAACLCDVNTRDEHGLPAETEFFLGRESLSGAHLPAFRRTNTLDVKTSLDN